MRKNVIAVMTPGLGWSNKASLGARKWLVRSDADLETLAHGYHD